MIFKLSVFVLVWTSLPEVYLFLMLQKIELLNLHLYAREGAFCFTNYSRHLLIKRAGIQLKESRIWEWKWQRQMKNNMDGNSKKWGAIQYD